MKKILLTLAVIGTLAFSGCSRVTVEPATVGKVLSPSGYSQEVFPAGKYTLGMREDMVILDVSTNTYTEPMDVILSDKLKITFDVRFRGRIRNDQKVINSMFNDITHGGDYKLSFQEVYAVYGKSAVRNVSRGIMSQYSVEDVHANYTRISKEIAGALEKEFVGTPIELSRINLGGVRYPDVVTNAVAQAKQRNMDIEREEAQAKIDLLKKENELKLVSADYEIEMTKAKTVADANKIMGESVTSELLELKRIEVNRIMAQGANKEGNTIYLPVEGLTTTGASVKMFNK